VVILLRLFARQEIRLFRHRPEMAEKKWPIHLLHMYGAMLQILWEMDQGGDGEFNFLPLLAESYLHHGPEVVPFMAISPSIHA